MNEEELARRLAGALSASAGNIDDRIARGLHAAREAALAVQDSAAPRGRHRRGVIAWRAALAAAMVALVVVAIDQHGGMTGEGSELEELDAALLADDLPIDAYLDQDFKAWLEQG